MIDVADLRRQAETPSVAEPGDLPSVAQDLSDAFADDVMFDWFLRPDAKRDAARLRFFRTIIVDLGKGRVRIDRPSGGGAAAVWMPSKALATISMIDEIRALPTLLHATGLSRFGRLTVMRADMDKHHPMERPHAYLWFLGVTPEAQGHGVGSALLRVANARLDAAGEPAYLETQTERNVALYVRHGYEVISEHRPRSDAPMLWSLWREPRTPSYA
jgi:ribosomal protein S18 acetylase RimI-like enzyme